MVFFLYYYFSNYSKNQVIDSKITDTQEKISITLNVLEKTYKISVSSDSTVYDLMTDLQNNQENNFSFQAKEYSGLGYFIEKINEVGSETGKYWIYYINDQKSQVGVSEYILKSGDVVSWKQE